MQPRRNSSRIWIKFTVNKLNHLCWNQTSVATKLQSFQGLWGLCLRGSSRYSTMVLLPCSGVHQSALSAAGGWSWSWSSTPEQIALLLLPPHLMHAHVRFLEHHCEYPWTLPSMWPQTLFGLVGADFPLFAVSGHQSWSVLLLCFVCFVFFISSSRESHVNTSCFPSINLCVLAPRPH